MWVGTWLRSETHQIGSWILHLIGFNTSLVTYNENLLICRRIRTWAFKIHLSCKFHESFMKVSYTYNFNHNVFGPKISCNCPPAPYWNEFRSNSDNGYTQFFFYKKLSKFNYDRSFLIFGQNYDKCFLTSFLIFRPQFIVEGLIK